MCFVCWTDRQFWTLCTNTSRDYTWSRRPTRYVCHTTLWRRSSSLKHSLSLSPHTRTKRSVAFYHVSISIILTVYPDVNTEFYATLTVIFVHLQHNLVLKESSWKYSWNTILGHDVEAKSLRVALKIKCNVFLFVEVNFSPSVFNINKSIWVLRKITKITNLLKKNVLKCAIGDLFTSCKWWRHTGKTMMMMIN